MCPACIGTAALMVAGVISTGGLATLARLKFRTPTDGAVHEPTGRALTNHPPTNHSPTNQNGEEQK